MDNYTCDITGGTANIVPGKDDQIKAKHPGPNKTWQYPLCNSLETTNTKFNKHLLQMHQIRKCYFYWECGFTNENTRSVGTHMRYCEGNPPEEHNRKLKYSLCKVSHEIEAGLQVHFASKHPEVRNEELKEKSKNFRWTNQELEFLVETIQRMKGDSVKNVNNIAAGILPNRTEAAIQRIRTRPEYKQAEEGVRQKELLLQKVLKTPRTSTNVTLTSKYVTRTPRTLPTVPPTPTPSRSNGRRIYHQYL